MTYEERQTEIEITTGGVLWARLWRQNGIKGVLQLCWVKQPTRGHDS